MSSIATAVATELVVVLMICVGAGVGHMLGAW
jgi:hypothetical protein